MASDIRISVRWKEQTVFAGEDIECIITFKNVANAQPTPAVSRLNRASSRQASVTGKTPQYVRARPQGAPHRRLPKRQTSSKGHRAVASLGAAASPAPDAASPGWNSNPGLGAMSGHKHQRSVSIVSLASDEGTANPSFSPREITARMHGRSHNRAASLQILPRRFEGVSAAPSPGVC